MPVKPDVHTRPDAPLAASSPCGFIATVGERVDVDAHGTHLSQPLWRAIMGELSELGPGSIVYLGSWRAPVSWNATEHAHLPARFRCSATLDELDRPITADYFTASSSEWINDFVLSAPPMFVLFKAAKGRSRPHTQNVGYETITWLRDFLGCSQERACRYGRVPPATFYMWRTRHQSMVRPTTVADALKLRSSLELASQKLGRVALIRTITSGSPSILDDLAGEEDDWNRAVSRIASMAEPTITSAVPRVGRAENYVEQLRRLDEEDSDEDGVVLGARKMSEEEIAEAESWGRD